MIKQALHDGWSVRAVSNLPEVPGAIQDAAIPARVPGCVHTDLMRAGLIDDPYFGLNEPKLLWIGRTDWRYTAHFDADSKLFDHERIDLACDGLDTVATIVLNGSEVARTQNMHRGYRFDALPYLKKGRNELTITFESPVNYANAMRDRLGHLPSINYGTHFNFIRKMACNFGWDWGPIVPTCGIWRDVRLEGWSGVRIKSVRLLPRSLNKLVLGADISVGLSIETENSANHDDHVTFGLGDSRGRTLFSGVSEDLSLQINDSDLRISQNDLWWPIGHGQQVRWTLNVETSIDSWEGRIGLRTVELDTHPDDIGRSFVLKVNGKPIFCKGFNWIPDDCFLDRACEPSRVRKRIQQALDANANMLRVWGGGIYETDEFYEICDEMGMLVWQDFPFACAAYPEAEPFKSEVEAEARYNVARLSHHPSLVLWNGCNENLWMYHDMATDDSTGKIVKWKEQVKDKAWGAGYYLDLLPKIVKELDPSRPYWAASPWSGDRDVENGLHPNLASHGNKHIWEVWHGPGDYANYRQFSPRFCSEFGYQGPANYSTMAKYFGDSPSPLAGEGRGEGENPGQFLGHRTPNVFEALTPHPNPLPQGEREQWAEWLAMHQKSPGGNERNDRLLSKDFDIPDNFDDWHYLLQLNQARALKAGVEWFRSRLPVCMGTLYWQLNDCYPVTSWSAIDSEGRLKPLWYATRRFFAPSLSTIQPRGADYRPGDPLDLFEINDSDERGTGRIYIRRLRLDGSMLAEQESEVSSAARSVVKMSLRPEICQTGDPSNEFIAVGVPAHAFWFFAPDRATTYPAPGFDSRLDKDGASYRLTIVAWTILRDIVIAPDRLDPDSTISDNVITLLPGDSFTFVIQANREMTLEELTTPPVFQCANRFGSKL